MDDFTRVLHSNWLRLTTAINILFMFFGPSYERILFQFNNKFYAIDVQAAPSLIYSFIRPCHGDIFRCWSLMNSCILRIRSVRKANSSLLWVIPRRMWPYWLIGDSHDRWKPRTQVVFLFRIVSSHEFNISGISQGTHSSWILVFQ